MFMGMVNSKKERDINSYTPNELLTCYTMIISPQTLLEAMIKRIYPLSVNSLIMNSKKHAT